MEPKRSRIDGEPMRAAAMSDDEQRIEYAKSSINELACQAMHGQRSGTIGVEISVKDGKLGKVKRVLIDFQKN